MTRREVDVLLRGRLWFVGGLSGHGLFLATVRTMNHQMIAFADAADKDILGEKRGHRKIPSGSRLASPPSPAGSAFRNKSGIKIGSMEKPGLLLAW